MGWLRHCKIKQVMCFRSRGMLFEALTALTCRYVPHALPELPWSADSSWTSSTIGLPEWDTSPSVSEVLGRGCVKPLVFMLVLLSSMKPHCTESAQELAGYYAFQVAAVAMICGYYWRTVDVHVGVAANSFPVRVHTVFSSQRIWWPRSLNLWLRGSRVKGGTPLATKQELPVHTEWPRRKGHSAC